MHIVRLQVEPEGFLGGLDLTFTPGLNVLVGARGTGKTSVIELLRWCLNAPGFTRDAAARGEQQSVAILEGAAATVYINRDGNHEAFTRSEKATSGGSGTPHITVLAQNEVESLGAQSSGRLFLIDRFRSRSQEADSQAEALRATVRSLTSQVASLFRQSSELRDVAQNLDTALERLDEAKRHQEELLAAARATRAEQEQLSQIEEAGKRLAGQLSLAAALNRNLIELQSQLDAVHANASRIVSGQAWSVIDTETASALEDSLELLSGSRRSLMEALNGLTTNIETLNSSKVRLDNGNRLLRQRLDAMSSGLGAATRTVQDLEEQVGRAEATHSTIHDIQDRINALLQERAIAYDKLDTLRESVFQQRETAANELNLQLQPQVRVRVEQARQTADYEAAIVAALKGTGLRYNSLAPLIAKAASPYELAIWAERNSSTELASATGIGTDRASAVLMRLREEGIEDILASHIEDDVVFELLDGRDFKPSDRLSIGQRCTVVLPILLSQHGSPLVIDQPEDHLDNAFIANTLVRALRNRRPTDQYIFVSHNANIPVLGEADNVIIMDSDGDRGYVRTQGPLNDPRIVEAITNLMEGGRAAFAARARFYEDHIG